MTNHMLYYFRSLKTKEKRIHRQLYIAMFIQIVIRLILYTDQYILRKGTVLDYMAEGGSSNSSEDATDDGGGSGTNASVHDRGNETNGDDGVD